jgi:hypothetical protein
MKNLKNNEPSLVFLKDHKIEPLPHTSLQEKAHLLYLHVNHNINLHLRAIGAVAIITTFCALTVFVAITLKKQLDQLYDDIINRRLVYAEFPYQIVGMEYYYQRVVGAICIFAQVAGIGFRVGLAFFENILQLKDSLTDFFASPNQLTFEIEQKDSSYPISDQTELANNFDAETNSFLDPFSINSIKRDWVHAPRFIKMGTYLFPLDSLLKKIFFMNEDGLIRHPVENRPITAEEQDTLLEDLSSLFQIDKNKMINYWDPYLDQDIRKNAAKRTLKDLIGNATASDAKAAVENSLLSDDLKEMITDWNSFNSMEKNLIMKQIKQDVFASKRLKKFLEILPIEILKLNIHNNVEDSFALQDILNEELNRSFTFQKRRTLSREEQNQRREYLLAPLQVLERATNQRSPIQIREVNPFP